MRNIEVTDSLLEEVGISYISASINQLVKDFGGDICESKNGGRLKLVVKAPEQYYDLYKSEIEDKIADVIAIKYKYDFLKRRLKTIGLSDYENEILQVAIISADIEDDRRYIIRKLRAFEHFTIDGIYNFRLQPLINKWKEVVTYIPLFFTSYQLCDFVSYVVGEKRGKRVFTDGKNVYDVNFNKQNRASLISKSFDVVKESLLFPCGAVEVIKAVSKEQERDLKRFFGRRVSFLKGSLPKMVDKKN